MPMRSLLLWLGLAAFSATVSAAEHRTARIVSLIMLVTVEQIGSGAKASKHERVGDVDRIRLTYDAHTVDTATQHVKLLNFQHWLNGHYLPPAPDPVMMPVTDSWLDLSRRPYRLHLRAAVVHGTPLIIEADESTRRLTIHPQDDPTAVLMSGPYVIETPD
jgi:hypothetical protein